MAYQPDGGRESSKSVLLMRLNDDDNDDEL